MSRSGNSRYGSSGNSLHKRARGLSAPARMGLISLSKRLLITAIVLEACPRPQLSGEISTLPFILLKTFML
jgi:hypothetical protein